MNNHDEPNLDELASRIQDEEVLTEASIDSISIGPNERARSQYPGTGNAIDKDLSSDSELKEQ